MPKVGETYQRKHGNKQTVTVVSVNDGLIKIKDADGIHFVSTHIFSQFFKEVKAG